MKKPLPRNSTHQAEALLVGDLARLLHRVTGLAIIVFVLAHVVVQSFLLVPQWGGGRDAEPWLKALQNQHWVHAILYFSIAFHTLYGVRLLLGDFGISLDYRRSLWVVSGVGALFALRELVRYAGI